MGLAVADALPAPLAAAVWHGDQIAVPTDATLPTGWAELDRELPGGGWQHRALSEILTAQPSVLEWRLLAPALRTVAASGRQIVVIGPPRQPYMPGLLHEGIGEQHLVLINAETPADRLWSTDQVIQSRAAGAVIAWLQHVRPEQLRRLQVSCQASDGPTFLFRPESARHESSAAPTRVVASAGFDWTLRVQIIKRRGPTHEDVLELPSIPGGLASVLTPRMRHPSRLIARGVDRAVGRAAASSDRRIAAA